MDEKQARKDFQYQITMSMARSMVEKGIICEKNYIEFNTIMKAKYCPIIGTLYSDIELINTK